MRVSFTDDAGHDETLTSAATTAVAPATPPAQPAGLTATPTAGSLDVAVDWDDVEGATDYLVRWRPHGPDQELNDGVRPTSSDTTITVAAHGSWVVRVEACNAAGCGAASALRFEVEQPTAPGQPENLALAAVEGEYEITAGWDATDGATSYRLGWRASDGNTLPGGTQDVTATAPPWRWRAPAGGRCWCRPATPPAAATPPPRASRSDPSPRPSSATSPGRREPRSSSRGDWLATFPYLSMALPGRFRPPPPTSPTASIPAPPPAATY